MTDLHKLKSVCYIFSSDSAFREVEHNHKELIMKDKDSKQDQAITSASEVELAEKELDQVSGGWIDIQSMTIKDKGGAGKIKPKEPDTRWKGEL